MEHWCLTKNNLENSSFCQNNCMLKLNFYYTKADGNDIRLTLYVVIGKRCKSYTQTSVKVIEIMKIGERSYIAMWSNPIKIIPRK